MAITLLSLADKVFVIDLEKTGGHVFSISSEYTLKFDAPFSLYCIYGKCFGRLTEYAHLCAKDDMLLCFCTVKAGMFCRCEF
jgi:hypothetical protein